MLLQSALQDCIARRAQTRRVLIVPAKPCGQSAAAGQRHLSLRKQQRKLHVCNVAETTKPEPALDGEDEGNGKPAETTPIKVTIDGQIDAKYTTIVVEAENRAGLLTAMTSTFRDLGLEVRKADIGGDDTRIQDTFWVVDAEGEKVTAEKDLVNIKRAIETILKSRVGGVRSENKKRPKLLTSSVDVPTPQDKKDLLYTLMDTYIKNDVLSIQQSIVNHVEYTMARSRWRFNDFEAYMATAYSLRDRLIESWNDTQEYLKEVDPKRVYYLSMEFLMGRSLLNALYNMDVKDTYAEALRELGYDLEKLEEQERDAALGNGGLGRLAACFLDSMATLNLPAWGYGIRYSYGMFRQTIIDGFQHEQPDYWLTFGNPWELERLNVAYTIKFYGHVSVQEENGRQIFKWNPGESVTAVAYDNPVPGFGTNNTINLRLWAAKPDREFDLEAFNTGDYVQAILSKQRAETLSSVLYPDDRTYRGKELRLKQQHFFVSASIQDVVRRFKERHNDWEEFPNKVAFQLNDTHPTIAVPELMRVLMDENKLGWTKSWNIATKVFAFTNHTVLPEALERWPVSLMEKLLPRHMQIVYDINWRFLQQLRGKFGDDWNKISRMSIIEEVNGEKYVRMAYLALVASHTINGVAAIHSQIIKETIFADFYDLWPEKFQNKTNGVTPRRWLAFCNPPLRQLITDTLGTDAWINELDMLKELGTYVNDKEFQTKWWDVKQQAKRKALTKIAQLSGVELNPDALLDIQVKRIHEYKRQLMNLLAIIHRYDVISNATDAERQKLVPKTAVIGGKAAPGYEMAKRIIKLINAVATKINGDPQIGNLLKLVFVPDYNVSVAEYVIPGAELSQHISTAGTEASGTSNMKFAMNGSLIVGTLDGANVELAQEMGQQNMFIFGLKADEVAEARTTRATLKVDPRFTKVVDMIRNGDFGWADYFAPLCDSITGPDFYLLANDFPAYLEALDKVDKTYMDKEKWVKMSIMSVASSGMFSSDRTIRQYAEEIWDIEPCPVPKA